MTEHRILTLRQAVTPVVAVSRLQVRSDRRQNPLSRIDRWEAALKLLDDTERTSLADNALPTSQFNINDLINRIHESKESVERRRWVLYTHANGRQVYLRDVFARLVHSVQQFRSAMNTLVQCDVVGHAGVPWAVILLCLNASSNDIETFGEMLETVTRVSEIVARNTEIEKQKFKGVSELKKQLSGSIIKLYHAVLRLLSRALGYYSRRTASRILRSVVQDSNEAIGKHLKAVDDAEQDVMRLVGYVNDEDQGKRINAIPRATAEQFRRLAAAEAESVVSRRAKLLEWLRAVSTEDTLRTTLAKKQEGTCGWIFEKEAFKQWSDRTTRHPSLLWIHGPPGFGKTFLSASICDRLCEQNEQDLAFFFCLAEDESRREPFGILRGWITQLLIKNDKTVHAAFPVYESRKEKDGSAVEADLWKLFQAVLKAMSQPYLVIDGFDECTSVRPIIKYHTEDGRTYFLQELLKALASTSGKVIIVSRDIPEISSALTVEMCEENDIVRLEHIIMPEDSSPDIHLCSKEMIRLKFPKKFSEETKDSLATEAASRSEGMFLWLAMFGKSMKAWDSEEKLRRKIIDMPAELEKIYDAELDRVLNPARDDGAAEIAKSILRWTLFAARPLRVCEMAEALALAPVGQKPPVAREDIVPENWTEIDNEYIEIFYKKPCGVLIQLQGRDDSTPLAEQTIHFPHFSIKEFLLRRHEGQTTVRAERLYLEDQNDENRRLAEMCLQYLCLDIVSDELNSGAHAELLRRTIKIWPFLEYTSRYWSTHASLRDGVAPELLPLVQKLFSPQTTHWRLWSEVFEIEDFDNIEDETLVGDSSDEGSDRDDNEPEAKSENTSDSSSLSPSPLYYAAYLGLTDIVADLHSQGFDCGARGGHLSYPLIASATNGHLKTVQYLVENGANVEETGRCGWTAMHYAAYNGQANVVRYLAEKGAVLDCLDYFQRTPLHHACMGGSTETLQVFQDHSKLLPVVQGQLESPLEVAIKAHQNEAVIFLLDHGVPVGGELSSKEPDISTPLGFAYKYGTTKTIDTLAGRGADLNTTMSKDNLLTVMAGQNSTERFLVLWKQDFRDIRPDEGGMSAIHHACMHDNVEILQKLLTVTLDIDVANKAEESPLIIASMFGALRCVDLLIASGASIDFQPRPGALSPLYVACVNGHVDILQRLIEHGADAQTTCHGHTGFDAGVRYGSRDVLSTLLSYGALHDTEGVMDDRVIDTARSALLGDMEEMKTGLDTFGGDEKQLAMSAALTAAAAGGAEDVATWLCDQGVRRGLVGSNGRSALHMALVGGHRTIAQRLLATGFDCMTPDDFDVTPICGTACAKGLKNEYMITELLMRGGMSPAVMIAESTSSRRRQLLGKWKGKYTYAEWQAGTEEDTSFEIRSYDACLAANTSNDLPDVSNEVLSTLFYDKSRDQVGVFAIHGQVINENKVAFVKLYERFGWLYHGDLSDDGKTMKGTWGSSPQLWHGTFEMHHVDGSGQEGEADTE